MCMLLFSYLGLLEYVFSLCIRTSGIWTKSWPIVITLSVNVMKEMHMTQNDQMKSDKLKLSSIGKNCQVIRHLLAPALSGGVYIITDHKNRRVLLMSASNYLWFLQEPLIDLHGLLYVGHHNWTRSIHPFISWLSRKVYLLHYQIDVPFNMHSDFCILDHPWVPWRFSVYWTGPICQNVFWWMNEELLFYA